MARTNMTAASPIAAENHGSRKSGRLFKVSVVIPNMEGGGAERFAVYLANGLAARGCDVDLVVLEAVGVCMDSVSPLVRLVDLKSRRVIRSIFPLIRYLRKRKPDALISNLEHMNLGAILARRLACVSTRVMPVVHIAVSKAAASDTSLRRRLVRAATKRVYRWADAVVAVSHDAAEDFARSVELPRETVRVIYPILTPGIAERSRLPVEHPWFAPGEPGVILAVGRLYEQKDFPALLRAFAIVRRRRNVRLMILGEGNLRGQLEDLVRELGLTDVVAMPGHSANVFAYMSRCALFVLSSAYEGMPMVIVEALASGATVVATDCKTGPAEILQSGKLGRLVPVGDPEALAAAMDESLAEPRRAAPEEALRPFSCEAVVEQYISLIAEITHA